MNNNEAEAFENIISRMKPSEDELSQAFRQGYIAGRCNSDSRLYDIATHYGYTAQREQFIEECAEAILAAQKCKRTSYSLVEYEPNLMNLAEEVADVLIMAEQMRLLISPELVDSFIEKKLERQLRRIEDEES